MDLGGFLTELRTTDTYKYLGKIEKIVGMTIEASAHHFSFLHYYLVKVGYLYSAYPEATVLHNINPFVSVHFSAAHAFSHHIKQYRSNVQRRLGQHRFIQRLYNSSRLCLVCDKAMRDKIVFFYGKL